MPFLVISILIQLALVVHIIKTGRNTSWVFIVLIFPLIGSLAYVIVELIPEWTGSRTARKAKRNFAKAINPERELREAIDQYAVANTVQNAMRLAELYLQHDNYFEAKQLYQRTLSGVHADDPELLLGLARAHFGLREYDDALKRLDLLKEKHPDRTSPDGHLLYARALQDAGRIPDAIREYESLVSYYPGPEPACRYAMILKDRGDPERARALLEGVVKSAGRSGKHYNTLHKDWVTLARREIQG